MNDQLFAALQRCRDAKQNILLTGLTGSAKGYLLSELLIRPTGKILCLVPEEEKAYDLYRDLQGFIDPDRVFLFPAREFAYLNESYSYSEVNRIITLKECLHHPRKNGFIITTPRAVMHKLVSPEYFKKHTIKLKKGDEKSPEVLIRHLVDSGYIRVETVTKPGEFALRGGILDIYPPGESNPVRIEYFGDFIESIRRFEVNNQLSKKAEPAVTITMADEFRADNIDSTLINYLEDKTLVFIDEPGKFYQNLDQSIKRYREIIQNAKREGKEVREIPVTPTQAISAQLEPYPIIYHSMFPKSIGEARLVSVQHVEQKEMERFYNNYDTLISRMKEWKSNSYTIKFAVKSRAAQEMLRRELAEKYPGGIEFIEREIDNGFVSRTLKIAIVSEKDLWGKQPTKQVRRRKREEGLLAEDLKIGDYVVHENYGIGIFRGIARVENGGVNREYLLLQYAGTDRLYMPVDKLDLLYKYTGTGEKEPKLSKLGGNSWEKTKKKVSQSIRDMAEDLIRLYAARQAKEGYRFSADTPWQRQFEDDFPYQVTPDQLKAIEAVKRDMESNKPMDRLICGDVGYGKTEVALRAAFKAVMDGKQVAVLVPTTVLAEQHFKSFSDRFNKYPVTIEVLSRFRKPGEQKRIVSELSRGIIDVIIGTHRLLSQDIKFKNLGLLIIDEEHRFGVAQKEKIKSYKELVDVISMSATPIPRSLHMSLTGLRDFSVIETPPPERYPITTYVLEYNEMIISEAINNEIERNGQVFFVHNRIEDIYKVKEKIESIVQGVSVAVGHGRMDEGELARVMVDFLAGKYQVFLCTTIIESGLDMPNVNTIIIDEADKMGLAQLYQLRGRVGRSNRMAYAYLTYRPDKVITEDAQKRLNAIRQFNELGSGIKVALRDLEIRGAGNILGAEQHGHIQAVGFDMYCRLLERETARCRGKAFREPVNPQLEIDIDYYIPDKYIADPGIKMRIYRRLLLAVEMEEIDEIREELKDRFGQPPQPVENFLQIARLRIMARKKEIKAIRKKGKNIELQVVEEVPLDLSHLDSNIKIRKKGNDTLVFQGEAVLSLGGLESLLTTI
ncbi:MAG: transcription-repair coupling factor [Syntrophomonadaceae bacterium]